MGQIKTDVKAFWIICLAGTSLSAGRFNFSTKLLLNGYLSETSPYGSDTSSRACWEMCPPEKPIVPGQPFCERNCPGESQFFLMSWACYDVYYKKIVSRNSSTFTSNPIKNSNDLWARVRTMTGKNNTNCITDPNINADKLNGHYASISTDPHYVPPCLKKTVSRTNEYLTEFQVFKMLDSLKSTAQGLDNVASWFLCISAPFLARPLSMLYNLSLSWSGVSLQWKSSVIAPVPKVPRPAGCSDYRPISVTPIVSRLLEKSMVTKFVYPIFVHPSCAHLFHDQFAFRPTGSTTAALINLVHNLADLLQTYPYVHLIALDFSKAFDTVRHSTLMQKFSKLPSQDNIYNWITNFLMDRDHCTKFQGRVSAKARISASIVQGTVTGPGSYDVNASDLHPPPS